MTVDGLGRGDGLGIIVGVGLGAKDGDGLGITVGTEVGDGNGTLSATVQVFICVTAAAGLDSGAVGETGPLTCL